MSQNPFAGWSKEDVERHNARVARGKTNEITPGSQTRSAGQLERAAEDASPQTASAPKKGATRTLVRIESRRMRLLDKDNLYGGAKPYCDALRYASAIPDDSPEAIELEVFQTKVRSEQEECTVIELIPL